MLQACIIGCGRIGCRFDDRERGHISTHASAYTHVNGVELTAAADMDEAKAVWCAERYGVRAYKDAAVMLGLERPDIVSICTGGDTRLPLVRRAVIAGAKAILCEKPIAHTLGDADEMIRLCHDAGVVLLVDHQRRFDALHQSLCGLTPDQITVYYGGGILNSGVHALDLLRFWLGGAAWVEGRIQRDGDDPDVDGWVQFQNGTMVALQSIDRQHFNIFEFTIMDRLGRIRVLSSGFRAEIEYVEEGPFGLPTLGMPIPLMVDGSGEFMLSAVQHVVDCVRNGRQPLCSGEDGRGALELVLGLRESARLDGQRILLPL